jgi:hypothetical protein
MNVLEDQVTDLNSLAGTPLPPLASSVMNSGSPAMSGAESPLVESGNAIGSSAKKRKGEDSVTGSGGGQTQQRAKRNRYISIAW